MNDTRRLMLLVEDRVPVGRSLERTLTLARELAARVIAVSIINEDQAPAGPGRDQHMSELEEAAWARLYEVEEEAFSRDVKVSLLLEQGEPLGRLLDLAESYEVDTLLLDAASRLPIAELIGRIDCEVELVGSTRPRPKSDPAQNEGRDSMEEE
ncbi:MAG: universal stress protein [candidate division WOR-3 bacterium]|nr:MAG: universal stress protein [candidate division WOR-3 bacterium]